MKVRRLATALSALLVSSMGCGQYHGPPQTQLDADLRTRAAFDLGCAADAVTLTPLADPNVAGIVPTQGATGCGKRATYVIRAPGGYVLNSPVTAAR